MEKLHLKGNTMNNVLKFSALALAAVLATGCSSMSKETEARLTATEDAAARAQARATKPTARLMTLWLLLRMLSKLLTKPMSALCVCWKKPAASNSSQGYDKPTQFSGSAFLLPRGNAHSSTDNKKPVSAYA